jgi:hypothetical protein
LVAAVFTGSAKETTMAIGQRKEASSHEREAPWIRPLVALAALALVGVVTVKLASADPTIVAASLAALAAVIGGIAALVRALHGRG